MTSTDSMTPAAQIKAFARAARERAEQTQADRWEADFPDQDACSMTIYDARNPLIEIAQGVSVLNAEHIAAARTDVPALAALVDAMADALENVKKLNAGLVAAHSGDTWNAANVGLLKAHRVLQRLTADGVPPGPEGDAGE